MTPIPQFSGIREIGRYARTPGLPDCRSEITNDRFGAEGDPPLCRECAKTRTNRR